jgi:hypothetical protein
MDVFTSSIIVTDTFVIKCTQYIVVKAVTCRRGAAAYIFTGRAVLTAAVIAADTAFNILTCIDTFTLIASSMLIKDNKGAVCAKPGRRVVTCNTQTGVICALSVFALFGTG